MNTQEKFEYWFDIAKYDLESAYGNFQIGRWLYVIFACQQALEKLLKGLYIILIDDNVPFIHNIGILLKKIEPKISCPISEETYKFCYYISRYYIVGRYPDYKRKLSTSLNKEKAESFLTKTNEVFAWLLTLKP